MNYAQGHEEPRCAPPFKGTRRTAASISLAEEGPGIVGISNALTYWPDFLVIKSMIWFTDGLDGRLKRTGPTQSWSSEPSRNLTVVESRGQPPSHEGAGEANKVLILELVKNILKDQATR